MHGHDHGAGAEEQQRLEEGVGEQVEHADRIGAHAHGDEHVAELRAGRIGDDALDVVLHEPDGRREQRRGRPDAFVIAALEPHAEALGLTGSETRP